MVYCPRKVLPQGFESRELLPVIIMQCFRVQPFKILGHDIRMPIIMINYEVSWCFWQDEEKEKGNSTSN